ncbi:MAG: hypothetical protein HFE78_07670 [Clostridiales bacterium]|nr:hypothetical protein [Clostridiales bacterium]
MKKVFIYSNSKETYTFLYSVEWLLGVDVDTIITTDESVFENIIDNFNFKISYYNSIDKCICNCDIAIVYNDRNIPENVTDYIKNASAIQNKTYIEIDSSKSAEYKKENKFDFSNENYFDIPAVVIFSLGLTTIPIKTELDINKIFMNAGVTINQFLSPCSSNIVKQFRDAGIGRSRVDLFNNNQANVSVYFFDLQNNLNCIKKYHNVLANIKPDYILVLTDNDFFDYDELLMYIKCYCFKHPDIIVKSRWLSIGNNMFCHLDNLPQEKNHLVLDFEDKNFYNKLQFDLLSKISLAEGIKRIK